MGIVLPNGILGNPAAEYIRWWILQHAWVLASVDLPVEVFIVEANVNIQTSVLFLKKKTQAEMIAEGLKVLQDALGRGAAFWLCKRGAWRGSSGAPCTTTTRIPT